MAILLDSGLFSITAEDGSIAAGWKLYFYQTGTTTLRNTYPTEADANAGTNPNANPITLDVSGRLPAIWLVDANYKCILKDPGGITWKVVDPIADGFAAALRTTAGASQILTTTGLSVQQLFNGLTGTDPILLVIAGQSNAAGKYANTSYNPSNSKVKTWDAVGGAWVSGGQYTSVPWTYDNPNGNLGKNNFALAAAHYLQTKTGRTVYIVFDAVGGTSIDQWAGVSFTATVAGTVMTVTSVTLGTIAVGQQVINSATGTVIGTITSLGTGTGGTGTYNLSVASTIASATAMTATATTATRYAALRTKIANALATSDFVSIGKATIDLFIWAQCEEDALTKDFGTYLASFNTLHYQLMAESWMTNGTTRYVMAPSVLHDRYFPRYALQHFCARSNGQWRYISTSSLRTPYQLLPSDPLYDGSDFTHWTGESLWRGGYDIIGPMFLNEGDQGERLDGIGIHWGRASSGMATPAEQSVIVTYDNFVNWDSRIGGFLTETFDGDGVTTAFLLDYRGTTISSVTVNGVAKALTTDYTLATGTDNRITITFVSAPAAGTGNIVISYGATVNSASANGSHSWGHACFADGNWSFAYGYRCATDNLCNYTQVGGYDSFASSTGDYALGWGRGLLVADPYQLVTGRFNKYTTAQSDPVVMQVGTGTNAGSRKNALAVRNSGAVEMENLPTYANNAAAIAGGLPVGTVYKTAAGALLIVV